MTRARPSVLPVTGASLATPTRVEKIIAAAKARHAPDASWSPESLAFHTQAVIHRAFVLAKAKNDVGLAADMILHLRRYIELLFHYAKD